MSAWRELEAVGESAVQESVRPLMRIATPSILGSALLVSRVDDPGTPFAVASLVGVALANVGLLAFWRWRPPRRAHPPAALTLLLYDAAVLAQLLAFREPALAGLHAGMSVAIASFLIDLRWMLGVQLIGLAGWLFVAANVEMTPAWQLANYAVLAGYFVAGASHWSIRRSLARVHSLTAERVEEEAANAAALQASEEGLRDAQRIAHVGSFDWDIATDRLTWSDEHRRIFGFDDDDPVDNQRFIDAVHPDDRERIVASLARSLNHGDPVELEYRIRRPDGEERVLLGRGETVRAGGRAVRHRGTSYDITPKHQVEQALRESESRLMALLTAMDAARAVVIRRDGRLSTLRSPLAHHGRYGISGDDVEGHDLHDFLPGELGDDVMAAVDRIYETGEREEMEAAVDLPGGTFHFDVSLRALFSPDGAIESVLAIVRDVTERNVEAQAQRRVQKLESLAVLAGGIAHDFNNLLVGILANADLARDRLGADSGAAQELEDIFRAGSRAAELVQELLVYAGAARLSTEAVDLDALVAETVDLLHPALPEGITVSVETSGVPVQTCGDAAQIRQVVMNFVLNAAEAMEGREGPVLVRVDACDVDAAYLEGCFVRAGARPGRHARIEVRDRGVGMDPATLERIFDPFFTTKAKGRGLGLASTMGIVRSHHGALRVETQAGHGTKLAVLLPEVDGRESEVQAEEPTPHAAVETILIVDDEAVVLQTAARLLGHEGYRVLPASGGSEALEVLKHAETSVDLALVDLTMPEMDGEEVFEALRAFVPGLPVVFMSGHSSEELARRIADKQGTAYLTKPFRREALREAVASLLEAEKGARAGR